ncbi:DNA cytosine methyltransferase [Lysobacter capsici]|uniref:DNA cytosine methyltransferase n=1 Tax=Lysobacter capsici TaxID=435897 RepID=UPI0006279343|nr:DNA cytosine methyltransferase [Lysobacter capsici]
MRSVELFAGAGGLAMGMGRAGFDHAAVVEWNHDACETFRFNQRNHTEGVEQWPLYEGDARDFDYGTVGGDVMVVSGGPPCQPFSLGGKHRGHMDERDMFPQAVRAVRELQPKAFIFENVKGLLRQSFTSYFEYIHLQLSHPDLTRRKDETWEKHRARLERYHTSNQASASYNVVYRLLNAANHGVPQRRERVFLVGFRSDLGIKWSFPEVTHGEDSLLRDQWVTGEYWDRHRLAKRARPVMSPRLATRIARLREEPVGIIQPWATVRDAISDLPDPEKYPRNKIPNHVFNPGARSYPGHTGSPLDEPAKTLKAGDHGVPGGENMLLRPDGSIRYFTVREAARLQTFPDDFVFQGSWSETMRQLGNAVPVRLAEVVSASVANTLRAAGHARAAKRVRGG